MTIPTQTQVDTWRATVQRLLADVQVGLFDLIDCGASNTSPRRRKPSERDLEATYRSPSGQDHHGNVMFQPTTKSQSRRQVGTPSDPTFRAVQEWEVETQRAVTGLYALVTAVEEWAGAHGLQARDGFGDDLERPQEPPTRISPHSGVVTVDVGPNDCRRAVQPAVVWLGAVYDQLGDRMRGCTDPEVGDHLSGQADLALRDLRGLARNVGGDRPRLCREGCRQVAASDGWCQDHRPRLCAGDGCDREVSSRRECERCKKRRQRSAA